MWHTEHCWTPEQTTFSHIGRSAFVVWRPPASKICETGAPILGVPSAIFSPFKKQRSGP